MKTIDRRQAFKKLQNAFASQSFEGLKQTVKFCELNNTSSKPLAFKNSSASTNAIPLYSSKISAGSPVFADESIEQHIDLNQYLVQNPKDTFLIRVAGDSMINAGIDENDILIVDKSLQARDGKIIVAMLNNEFTVKRLKIKEGKFYLQPENPDYRATVITEEMGFSICGVVIHVLKSF